MKLANDKVGPFVLTRAGFTGSQRYVEPWIGRQPFHLGAHSYEFQWLFNCGQPLFGPDIDGFTGMHLPSFLQGGWVQLLCFLFAVGTMKWIALTMSHGLSPKRFDLVK